MPDSLRFQVLKDGGGRCALCGASKEKRPLEVDHIIAILAVPDLNESAAVVLEREQIFKRKLGSVAHGLNAG